MYHFHDYLINLFSLNHCVCLPLVDGDLVGGDVHLVVRDPGVRQAARVVRVGVRRVPCLDHTL